MTIIRVKGFQIFRDRFGKWRCYHRKTRVPVDLDKVSLGSAAFFAECSKIAALAEARKAKVKPDTLGLLIRDYRGSPSHRKRDSTIRKFSTTCGQSPIRLWRVLTARLLCAFAIRPP